MDLRDLLNELENEEPLIISTGLSIRRTLADKLYKYQIEGVEWLHNVHNTLPGCILADDMGLGKTVQIITLLDGLMKCNEVATALIVAPKTLITNWMHEFKKWAPNLLFNHYEGTAKKRSSMLSVTQRLGGIILVSYHQALFSANKLGSKLNGRTYTWDYIILDEGHKIKNPSQTTTAIRSLEAEHRIIITGTPLQNKLMELWHLFHFLSPGRILGTQMSFKTHYESIIVRSRERDASNAEKQLGNKMSESLNKIIQPYILRRTKDEVSHCFKNVPKLPEKHDLVVWIYPTETQERIYKDFISLKEIKMLITSSASPLAQLTVLKKLCDHPRLLSAHVCERLNLDFAFSTGEDEKDAHKIDHVPTHVLKEESAKIGLLHYFATQIIQPSDKVLIFSQSLVLLRICERILREEHFHVLMLNGSLNCAERFEVIRKFTKKQSRQFILSTTQVGGVGLNITAANVVIILDPSWNPATDAQAIDRAYRIGQERNVKVYRFITCGTLEEKIFRKQIFKSGLSRRISNEDPSRHFTQQQLRELFVLDDTRISQTKLEIDGMYGPTPDDDFVKAEDFVFGITRYDTMFHEDREDLSVLDTDKEHIEKRVEMAKSTLEMESQTNHEIQVFKPLQSDNTRWKPSVAKQKSLDLVTQTLKSLAMKNPSPINTNKENEVVVLSDDGEDIYSKDVANIQVLQSSTLSDLDGDSYADLHEKFVNPLKDESNITLSSVDSSGLLSPVKRLVSALPDELRTCSISAYDEVQDSTSQSSRHLSSSDSLDDEPIVRKRGQGRVPRGILLSSDDESDAEQSLTGKDMSDTNEDSLLLSPIVPKVHSYSNLTSNEDETENRLEKDLCDSVDHIPSSSDDDDIINASIIEKSESDVSVILESSCEINLTGGDSMNHSHSDSPIVIN